MFSSYIDSWLNHSNFEKEKILDTTKNKTMKEFGFRDDFTKKRYMSHVLSDCLTTSNLNLFKKLSKKALEMQGTPIDDYYINSVIVDYHLRMDDYNTAIEICIATFNKIEQYLPELKAEHEKRNKTLNEVGKTDEISTLPNYIFCRDYLTILLVNTKRFDEAEKFEKLFYDKNLYPAQKDKKIAKHNKLYRLRSLVDYYLSNYEPNSAIYQCENILAIDEESAAYGYKKIGNYYLKDNKNKEAYDYLNKAFELHPSIEGIDIKLKRLSKKLGLQHEIDTHKIIDELIKKENANPKWFELRSIAQRYLSIEEFDEAIRIFTKLIDEHGRDNKLIEGLSKTYKAIANKNYMERHYDAALKNYVVAFQIIENPEFPTKTSEKQKEILERAIEKTMVKTNQPNVDYNNEGRGKTKQTNKGRTTLKAPKNNGIFHTLLKKLKP